MRRVFKRRADTIRNVRFTWLTRLDTLTADAERLTGALLPVVLAVT